MFLEEMERRKKLEEEIVRLKQQNEKIQDELNEAYVAMTEMSEEIMKMEAPKDE
jgi:septal ring factor EnvC (AmiA/AmiB activator)